MEQNERRRFLIDALLDERPEYREVRAPADGEEQRLLLRACLKLAAENELESVAFCCISTGEFHFPNELAAEIAVKTVGDFIQKETSVRKVIFNVFKDRDEEIYRKLLGAGSTP